MRAVAQEGSPSLSSSSCSLFLCGQNHCTYILEIEWTGGQSVGGVGAWGSRELREIVVYLSLSFVPVPCSAPENEDAVADSDDEVDYTKMDLVSFVSLLGCVRLLGCLKSMLEFFISFVVSPSVTIVAC